MTEVTTALGLSVGETIVAIAVAGTAEGEALAYSSENTSGAVVQTKPGQLQSAPTEATTGSIGTDIIIDWAELSDSLKGGVAVDEYKVYIDGSGTASATVSGSTFTATFSSRTVGSSYSFTISAVNIYGESDVSDPIVITAANVADALAAPTTSMDGTDVKFTWVITGNDNSSTVTSYKLKVRDKAQTPTSHVENASCNASMTGLTCFIAMTEFTSTLGYSAGEVIEAQVYAVNGEGDSSASPDSSSTEVV